MKPWAIVRAIKYSAKLNHWTALIRTPGSRVYIRLTAATYPEILTLYLANTFDRESLMAAAQIAETRETLIKRVRSVENRKRKELDET